MTTFLPYPDYVQSAKVLDWQRLGKQRVECKQILNTVLGYSQAWRNHPAILMWIGYPDSLIEYGFAICNEWTRRGYKDSIYDQLFLLYGCEPKKPYWLGREEIHSSHRGRLLKKDFTHYSQFGWTEEPRSNYVWPV